MQAPTAIYLDHAATTPLDPRVADVMIPILKEDFGNASSLHTLGRKARYLVEESRERIASVLGAAPGEIVFTSGGTESNNAALRGRLRTTDDGLVTSAVEHEAILQPAALLERAGHPVRILTPGPHGAVSPEAVAAALDDRTALVSIMHANNEIGTLSDVPAIAAVCHEHGVPLHCDAVQTAGLLALDVEALEVDVLSVSAHKLYGPKGVGLLYVRSGIDMDPLVLGGAQERRRRGGTENVAGIAGFAEALALAAAEAPGRAERIRRLRDELVRRLRDALGDTLVFNTPLDEGAAAPHVVNISFPPQDGAALDGEMLLLNLDMEGVYVSAGSACTSGALEPSHVVLALGRDRATAAATVRLSLGKDTTAEQLEVAVDRLAAVVRRMRGRVASATA